MDLHISYRYHRELGFLCREINVAVDTRKKPIEITGSEITIKGCSEKPIIVNTSEDQGDGVIFRIRDSWGVNIRDVWCNSMRGIVVDVEDSKFFTISDCMMVGSGSSDNPGIIRFK